MTFLCFLSTSSFETGSYFKCKVCFEAKISFYLRIVWRRKIVTRSHKNSTKNERAILQRYRSSHKIVPNLELSAFLKKIPYSNFGNKLIAIFFSYVRVVTLGRSYNQLGAIESELHPYKIYFPDYGKKVRRGIGNSRKIQVHTRLELLREMSSVVPCFQGCTLEMILALLFASVCNLCLGFYVLFVAR
ncbi:hypothetical protein LEP1GSC055_1008 [Leptospira borgpetersenii str. Brem 307]|uniref:PF07600 family protein n=1 Tax=Leptospira borgpetersenii str. Brem 328 TaxID=1049780 RepID=A0ABC9SME6_LEPBO|nr:hypothetical protein LEP1GSC055_1008 [Leptospira borgpetersenii str. Brem 307]EMN18995.1 hypothetical protein LEP1GSC056_1761 [Leptospira borgpetersenii str. Brem 328]